MVPRTRDDRVMFAIPWHDHAVVGTTDTPITEVSLEPRPLPEEIDFILETASGYLAEPPTRADVLSAFAGIRPLVKAGEAGSTAALSREHTIQISKAGLLTIAGGKWTTYRKMAEDCVNHAATLAGLDERPCVTRDLHIHGYHLSAAAVRRLRRLRRGRAGHWPASWKGGRTSASCSTPNAPILAAQVFWAVRHEMALTVDDVLARRTRAAVAERQGGHPRGAGRGAASWPRDLGKNEDWEKAQVTEFTAIAERYLPV